MQKLLLIFGGLVAVALALAVTPAGAAPKSATLLELDCGEDGAVNVHVKVDSSSAAVFDATGEGGRIYLVQSLEVRVYEGEHAVEPIVEPDFEFLKEYGNRNGLPARLECTGSFIDEEPGFGAFTIFFDVTLAGK